MTFVPHPDLNFDKDIFCDDEKAQYDSKKTELFFAFLRNQVYGAESIFNGPHGTRRIVYCDYAASGKPLKFLEEYIQTEVLPNYSAIPMHHCTDSAPDYNPLLLNTLKVLKKSFNCLEDDLILFPGSGATSCVNLLIYQMDLKHELAKLDVVISPFEHYSNILPWNEIGATVHRLEIGTEGNMHLTAASNITGVTIDVDEISKIVHKHDGLVFWDYATAGPYLPIDMNPDEWSYKDAVFLSTHKFVGGPNSPGILLMKKRLIKSDQETEVNYQHVTTDVIGSVRCCFTIKIKSLINMEYMLQREQTIVKKIVELSHQCSSFALLGGDVAHRLCVFSFVICHSESGKLLHYNFVGQLLNDFFGIQSRSGQMCSGPYVYDLLNISESLAEKISGLQLGTTCGARYEALQAVNNQALKNWKNWSLAKTEDETHVPYGSFKPGLTRISMPYFADDDTVNLVINAIRFIAEEGWKLLPLYEHDPYSGTWRCSEFVDDGLRLSECVFSDKAFESFDPFGLANQNGVLTNSEELITEAEKKVQQVIGTANEITLSDQCGDFRNLCWYLSPCEALGYVKGSGNGEEKVKNDARNCLKVFQRISDLNEVNESRETTE